MAFQKYEPMPRDRTRLRAMEIGTVLKTRVKCSIVTAGNYGNSICFRLTDRALESLGYKADDASRCAFALRGNLRDGIRLQLVGDGEGRRYNPMGGLRFGSDTSNAAGFTQNLVSQVEVEATVEAGMGIVRFERFPANFSEAQNPSPVTAPHPAPPPGMSQPELSRPETPVSESASTAVATLEKPTGRGARGTYKKTSEYWTNPELRKRKQREGKGKPVDHLPAPQTAGFNPVALKAAIEALNVQLDFANEAGVEVVFGKSGHRFTAHLKMDIT